jgi:D-inositol-3-phosphate glycosyltransferase
MDKKIKVALIEPIAIPGMWKYDLGLTTELSMIGVDASIISSKAFPLEATNPNNIPILRKFPNLRNTDNYLIKAAQYSKGIYNVYSHLRANKYDIIHWQLIYVYPPLDAWLGKMLYRQNMRLIVTVHDIKPFSFIKCKQNYLFKKIFKSAARLIVHGDSNKEELEKRYPTKSIIKIVPHGGFNLFLSNPADKKASRRKLGLPENSRIILFFGQIKKEKGLIYLIRATKTALSILPDIHLVIAGRPCHMDLQECINAIDSASFKNRITLDLNHIEEDKMKAYFSASDVVALPYLSGTQSGVLLQAMTYGIPVIASDVGALGPTVKNSSAGIIVAPGRVDQLSGAIVKILSDENLSQQMARSARNAINNEYSWKTCAKKTMDIYREVINEKSSQ